MPASGKPWMRSLRAAGGSATSPVGAVPGDSRIIRKTVQRRTAPKSGSRFPLEHRSTRVWRSILAGMRHTTIPRGVPAVVEFSRFRRSGTRPLADGASELAVAPASKSTFPRKRLIDSPSAPILLPGSSVQSPKFACCARPILCLFGAGFPGPRRTPAVHDSRNRDWISVHSKVDREGNRCRSARRKPR